LERAHVALGDMGATWNATQAQALLEEIELDEAVLGAQAR
jgi:hypothetical protein